jgi:hypothetical protein
MIFQAWVDDSGNEPQSPIMVLAGFLASYDEWAKFSDAWDEELAKPPKLQYFKMAEAARLRGEFDRSKGWDEATRDARVLSFARIIRKYARIRLSAWIRHADWNTNIVTIPAPIRRLSIDHPYGHLFSQIIFAAAVFQDRHGINEPCDFIFDEQVTFSEEVMRWWPQVKDWIKERGRSDLIKFIGSPPIFRDEKKFKPLQAADLYAWQIRNHYVANHRVRNQTIRIPRNSVLQTLWPIGAINREISTAEIIRLREHLLEVGKRFVEENPTVELLAPIADRKERQKAHRSARNPRPKKGRVASSSGEQPC